MTAASQLLYGTCVLNAPMHQTRKHICIKPGLHAYRVCSSSAALQNWNGPARQVCVHLPVTRASAEQPTARCLTSSRLQGTVPVHIWQFTPCTIHSCMQVLQAMQTQFCVLISSVHRCSAHLMRKHWAAGLCAKVYIEVRVERRAALLIVNIDLRAC